MASAGYLVTLLGPLPVDMRKVFTALIDSAFRTISFGTPEATARPTTNFAGHLVPVTTSPTASQEVAVAHGLSRTPRFMFPALDPNTVNATIPVVTVSRAADATNLYLTSATQNATFWLYVE